MRIETGAYLIKRVLIGQPLRFLLEFDGLTNEYASGDFSGRNTSTQKLYLGKPQLTMTEIDPIKPAPQFMGSFIVPIQDNGNEITSLIANNAMLGRKATLKFGYESLTEAQFMTYFVGKVVDYPLDDSLQNYVFRIESAFPDLNKTAFTGLAETNLNGQVSQIHFNTTMAAAPTLISGSEYWVELNRAPDGLETNDILYFEHASTSSTNETAPVKEIQYYDAGSGNPRVRVDLTNTYIINSIVNTHKIVVDSVTDFATSAPANPPFADGTNLIVDQEIIKYDSVNAGSNRFNLGSGTRTVFNSLRQRHQDNATVRECWIIRDDPITLLLNVLTTTPGGANGSYDLGITNFGIGMDDDLIDFSSFELIRDQYFYGDEMRFMIDRPMEVLEFMKDIASVTGMYYYPNQNGLLGARKVKQVTGTLSVASLDDGDWLPATMPRWIPSIDSLINEVEIRYNWVPGMNKFLNTNIYELADSKTAYGTTRRLVIESKGLRTGSLHTTFVNDYLPVLAKRYGNQPPRIEASLDWSNVLLEAGDVIKLTSSHMPNINTGARDLTDELVELVKVEPKPETGEVEIAGYMYYQEDSVSVGSTNSVVPSDSTAVFNITDSTAVQGDDATFDNSAELAVAGTRVLVTVKILLGIPAGSGNMQIDYHIRVGYCVHTADITSDAGCATPGSVADLDYSHVWIAPKYDEGHVFTNVHSFDGLASAQYDVKLDYYGRSGVDAVSINSITLAEVTIETDGATYTELT
ncbi:MAG: hypothetical protein ACE5HX_00870 [bacterium]